MGPLCVDPTAQHEGAQRGSTVSSSCSCSIFLSMDLAFLDKRIGLMHLTLSNCYRPRPMRRRAACVCSFTGAFCLYPGSAFHVSASHALVAAFMIGWQPLLSGQFQMQRSMQLDVALLELKPICDEAILCLSFACLFVPHGSHMHLRDQKAHMQMRLQDVCLKRRSWIQMRWMHAMTQSDAVQPVSKKYSRISRAIRS